MNNHTTANYNKPYPAGFNATDFLVDPGTYIYYNATMQSNQDPPRNLPGEYSTDVVASRAVDFMTQAAKSGSPFFLTVAPVGPHGETCSAIRHKDLYQDAKVPRGTNFNPDTIVNASSYFKTLPIWNQTVIEYYDEFYRLRLASLRAVDDLVDTVVGKVDELDIMETTYIIYTSDNGFHIGQHRLPAGKSCAIEEDINVPFFIRGPSVPKNLTVKYPTSHTDIAPTLFDLAGIPLRDDFDGVPMPIRDDAKQVRSQEHVNVEFWGSNIPEGKFGPSLMATTNNNTYKTLRLISDDFSFNLLYIVWCRNERELYDSNADPGQINNVAIDFHARAYTDLNYPEEMTTRKIGGFYADDVQYRLDALLLVLKTCKGNTCVQPWKVLHPDGTVNSLKDAMSRDYQCFYRGQPNIEFGGCVQGYIQELEGPGSADVIIWDASWEKTPIMQIYGCEDRT
ncbi:hypothetical protein LTR24_001475 [Lithohypha guttulata]|uniref:Sulfatase N-terminal domain-containing protein n=1 Tax=Lithohypha guttulata TaxID=1690604 RepID=A0ABR0KKG7_9EURO|nr:hypothetical protein LTR24_001475 [Lithohypha guttulata]